MQAQSGKPQRKQSVRTGAAAMTAAGENAAAGPTTSGGVAERQGALSQRAARPSGQKDAESTLTPSALIHLSEEHTNQLREAFDMFDSAGTGRIKVCEVKVAFYALGYAVNSVELGRVLREAGVQTATGPNGEEPTMDFSDFYNVLLRKMTEKESRTESVRAFTQIDQDNKGFISLEDLREIADSLHMELTDDELVEMVLFAQSASAGVPGGNRNGVSGGNVATEFGARESLAVTEDQFLKLLKRANVF